jgi:hypothetical protein
LLFVSQAALAVGELLDAADVRGRVALIGQPRLVRAVSAPGREVLLFASALRALRRSRAPRACAGPGALPLATGALGGLVAVGMAEAEDWAALLAEWCRVVENGGRIVMLDRGDAAELSRRALCAGLVELSQRQAGRGLVTAGSVFKLPAARRLAPTGAKATRPHTYPSV